MLVSSCWRAFEVGLRSSSLHVEMIRVIPGMAFRLNNLDFTFNQLTSIIAMWRSTHDPPWTKSASPYQHIVLKIQLDFDIEPTLRFRGMTSIERQMDQSESKVLCCGQLWVWHMYCSQDLWWAMPLHISIDHVGIPYGFQPIIWTFVRHTVSRYLIFQFLPTGLHGLCFGCCFSGPLPLHSLINGPPIGVSFLGVPSC